MRRLRPSLWLLLPLAASLLGCDARRRLPKPLADYLAAVEAHTRAVEEAPPVLDGLPRQRERRIEIPEGPTLDVRGFLGVHNCGLGEVVGGRNNALGRVMTYSQRALYTLKFMTVAERCLPGLEPPLSDTLQTALDHKRRHLPADVFNAVWAGREVALLFAPDERPFEPGNADRAARSIAALVEVVEALRDRRDGDIEGALGPLHGLRVASSALRRLAHARYVLAAIVERLDAVDGAACATAGAALRSAFDGHYVKRVQPLLAESDHAIRPLLTGLDRLYRASVRGLDPPPALAAFHRAYLIEDGGLRAAWRSTLRAHAAAWQRLFARCGQPGIGPTAP